MAFDFDPQKVKERLDQCMEDHKLREILAKEGIPESEPTTLSIKCIDNDNMNVITDYEIPTTSPQVPVTPTEIDFDQEINDFLDHTETYHGLLGVLPMSDRLPDGTTRTLYRLTFNSSLKTISTVTACCGPPWKICP